MSTPMRHGPSQQGRTPSQQGRTPSQQGRTPSQHTATAPTPQASTPFSTSQAVAALSPYGPRSSPQQLKKSPAMGTLSSGIMVGQPGSQPLNFDSPSAAAALGGLGLDINLDNLSVGGLVGGQSRSDEDDRKKRMDAVSTILWAADTGRVSNDGLERLAVHLGLECLWEPAGSGSENDKVLIIAGRTMGVEVSIKNHVVYRASLTFNEPSPSLDKHVEKASEMLFQDLALGPGESQVTKKLSRFRTNLERLATLDRLSITPGVNCHEAVAGIWESLERLHRWDVERLREDPTLSNKSEEQLRTISLCSRHGCPLMHTRGHIGLTLDYWKQHHALPTAKVEGGETGQTWGILVDCGPANSMVYTPVRVSDKWLGPDIIKTNPTDDEVMSATGPILDWLEPPAVLLPPTEENKSGTGLDSTTALASPKPIDAVFMATFNPPIVVTNGIAMEIYKLSAFNAPLPGSTFDNLLFPVTEGTTYDPSEPRVMSFTQTVPVFLDIHSGQRRPVLRAHRNTLLVDKPVYGQVITQLPISHPKDLIPMLPMLRQYALLSLLLNNSFKPRKGVPLVSGSNTQHPQLGTNTAAHSQGRSMSKESDEISPTRFKVDIVLSAHPIPRLQLVFPFRQTTAMINLEIQLNGKIHIISDNIFSESETDVTQTKGKGKLLTRKECVQKLEVCENIGIWVEFIKHKLE